MKALGLVVVILLTILAFTVGVAQAEREVAVRKGDTLWKLAKAEWSTGKLWTEIAIRNDIKDPKKLKIGKKLIMPDVENVSIKHHQTAPYGAKAEVGNAKVLEFINGINIEENIKEALQKVVTTLEPEPYVLMKGETAKYVSDAAGVYGNGFTTFTFEWKKVDYLKAWRWSVVVENVAYELIIIEACGNVNLRWQPLVFEKVEQEVIHTEPEEIVSEGKVLYTEEPAIIVPVKEVIYTDEQECDPELEVIVGNYVWAHDPAKADARTFGKGGYAEAMYWTNCEGNCSSEHWWGVGALVNAYDYAADDFPSEGGGWRAAGEIGLKRLYSENALARSWQMKLRLGYEESSWKNSDTGDGIRQRGPVFGLYHEHVRELRRNKLWFLSQTELWSGFSQDVNSPDNWNIDPQSRTYFQTMMGVDYRLAPRLTGRAQVGYGYQDWDSESLIPANLQLIYHLPHGYGKLAVGPYAHFYPSSIGNTYGALIRYESGDLFRKILANYAESNVKFTGRGIANSQTADVIIH